MMEIFVISAITVSGVAEEFIAGLLVTIVVGLVAWPKGREQVAVVQSCLHTRITAGWRRVWAAHPFIKLAVAWWVVTTTSAATDTLIVPVPDALETASGAWILSMFAAVGVLWLRRRLRRIST